MQKRKTPEEKLEELEKKQSQITARIQKTRAQVRGQERKKDTRRKIIAGALALEHMAHNSAFRETMGRLLRENVKRPEDQKLFDL